MWEFKKYNGGVDWIDLDKDRNKWLTSVNMIMNLQLSYNAGSFLIRGVYISFSRMDLPHAVS